MNAPTDQQLLEDFAESHSDAAFAELARRHVDLVYSAALRMVYDSHLAEDVAQGVFVALAQNARQLTHHPVLSGWLHRTTQNLAANAVRTNVRRQTREQEAVAMNELLSAEPDANWELIAPQLDTALGELSEPDRDAVLLRYFERKSAREIALTLGISDDAAQKRVSRAVERLREFFTKRGVTIGASGLAVVISANAVQAAPAGLAVTISTAVATTAAASLASTATVTTTKVIAMTTVQKILVTVTVAALAGAGIFEARQSSALRGQVQSLQQQQAPLTEEIQQLQGKLSDATNRMAGLTDEIAMLNRSKGELLRLRGEVGVLQRQAAELKQQVISSQTPPNPSVPNDALEREKRGMEGKMFDGVKYSAQIRSFADKNQGWTPTNWLQIISYTNQFPVSGTNHFEFVHKQSINYKQLGTNFENTVVIREWMAWQDYYGKWCKVYGYASGYSQVVRIADGNFMAWEEQNTYNPETAAR